MAIFRIPRFGEEFFLPLSSKGKVKIVWDEKAHLPGPSTSMAMDSLSVALIAGNQIYTNGKLVAPRQSSLSIPSKNWMGPNPNGPLKPQDAIQLLDTQVFSGVRSVGPGGDFLEKSTKSVFQISPQPKSPPQRRPKQTSSAWLSSCVGAQRSSLETWRKK